MAKRSILWRVNRAFTRTTDAITWDLGLWPATVLATCALVWWIGYGVLNIGHNWFTSPEWNFPLNTFTTLCEFYFELWILSAANRGERRNRRHIEQVHRQLAQIMEKLAAMEKRLR